MGNLRALSVFFTYSPMKKAVPTILAAMVVAVPAAAEAKKKPNYLWATVNVCDTKRHPDRMGIRARMPGNGTHQRMYVRFTAQYHDTKRGDWRRVDNARSGWELAGSARYRWKEAGITFRFKTPPRGVSYVMRGYVQFQWREKRKHRRGWHVVRRTHRLTSAGHPGTRDSDPPGYSAAHCKIATPLVK